MNAFGYVALYGWPVVVFGLFTVLKPRIALLSAFVVGFLFLPSGAIVLPAFPDYDKFTATSLGSLLGVLVFDSPRVRSFRPSLLDLPMLVWCTLAPMATAISNDLGWYYGLSDSFAQVIFWGLPFLLGRIYFRDAASLKLLAKALIIAGILYVPFCLWEIRMSPQLHASVYGYHQRPFLYLVRYTGYRPIVFLQSGLAVGMVMASAAIMAYWMFRSRAVLAIRGVPLWPCIPVLALTVVLGKTSAAITFVVVGCALFTAFRASVGKLALIVLLLAVTTYPALRISGLLSGERVIAAAALIYPEERVQSLGVRLKSEDLMAERAMLRPVFGWGGYGRIEVHDSRGRRVAIPDGLWLIAVAQYGLVGLISLMAIYLVPPFLLLRRHPGRAWTQPSLAPVTALTVVLILYWVDSLANAMLNMVLVLGIGGLTGYHAQPSRRRSRTPNEAPAGEGSIARA